MAAIDDQNTYVMQKSREVWFQVWLDPEAQIILLDLVFLSFSCLFLFHDSFFLKHFSPLILSKIFRLVSPLLPEISGTHLFCLSRYMKFLEIHPISLVRDVPSG